jgi:hypothetical protein
MSIMVAPRNVLVTERRGVVVRMGRDDAPVPALTTIKNLDELGNPVRRDHLAADRARVANARIVGPDCRGMAPSTERIVWTVDGERIVTLTKSARRRAARRERNAT